jgi:hypothetical protein
LPEGFFGRTQTAELKPMAAHTPTDPRHFTVATFQQRRRDTWKAIRIWVLVEALAVLTFPVAAWSKLAHAPKSAELFEPFHYNFSLGDITLWQLNLAFGVASALIAATIAIVMAIQRHYRCPKCETVPMGSWTTFALPDVCKRWAVEFNPSSCPKCSARLR